MRPDPRRDQRIADDAIADRALMCIAAGCPNRWAVDAGNGRLCSAHAWSDPHLWPRITQEQLDEVADRARWSAEPAPEPIRLSRDEKLALLQRLRAAASGIGNRQGGRAWAYRLRDRHRSGERLTSAQVEAYQSVVDGRSRPNEEGVAA